MQRVNWQLFQDRYYTYMLVGIACLTEEVAVEAVQTEAMQAMSVWVE